MEEVTELVNTPNFSAKIDDDGVLTLRLGDHTLPSLTSLETRALIDALKKHASDNGVSGAKPDVPAEGIANFCMSMTGIGISTYGLLRAGGQVIVSPELAKDPGVQMLLRQLDSGLSQAVAAQNAGRRVIV